MENEEILSIEDTSPENVAKVIEAIQNIKQNGSKIETFITDLAMKAIPLNNIEKLLFENNHIKQVIFKAGGENYEYDYKEDQLSYNGKKVYLNEITGQFQDEPFDESKDYSQEVKDLCEKAINSIDYNDESHIFGAITQVLARGYSKSKLKAHLIKFISEDLATSLIAKAEKFLKEYYGNEFEANESALDEFIKKNDIKKEEIQSVSEGAGFCLSKNGIISNIFPKEDKYLYAIPGALPDGNLAEEILDEKDLIKHLTDLFGITANEGFMEGTVNLGKYYIDSKIKDDKFIIYAAEKATNKIIKEKEVHSVGEVNEFVDEFKSEVANEEVDFDSFLDFYEKFSQTTNLFDKSIEKYEEGKLSQEEFIENVKTYAKEFLKIANAVVIKEPEATKAEGTQEEPKKGIDLHKLAIAINNLCLEYNSDKEGAYNSSLAHEIMDPYASEIDFKNVLEDLFHYDDEQDISFFWHENEISFIERTLKKWQFNKEANEEQLNGGLGDNKTIKEIAKEQEVPVEQIEDQAKKGIEVEYEHTSNPEVALEIAKDHLSEDPEYYDKLEEIEAEEDISPIEKAAKFLGGEIKILNTKEDKVNHEIQHVLEIFGEVPDVNTVEEEDAFNDKITAAFNEAGLPGYFSVDIYGNDSIKGVFYEKVKKEEVANESLANKWFETDYSVDPECKGFYGINTTWDEGKTIYELRFNPKSKKFEYVEEKDAKEKILKEFDDLDFAISQVEDFTKVLIPDVYKKLLFEAKQKSLESNESVNQELLDKIINSGLQKCGVYLTEDLYEAFKEYKPEDIFETMTDAGYASKEFQGFTFIDAVREPVAKLEEKLWQHEDELFPYTIHDNEDIQDVDISQYYEYPKSVKSLPWETQAISGMTTIDKLEGKTGIKKIDDLFEKYDIININVEDIDNIYLFDKDTPIELYKAMLKENNFTGNKGKIKINSGDQGDHSVLPEDQIEIELKANECGDINDSKGKPDLKKVLNFLK